MNWLRRFILLTALTALLGTGLLLAQPSPPAAKANPLCATAGVVAGGVGMVGDVVGFGNPASDICNKVTDGALGAVTAPVTDALKGIGNGIFNQVTTWAAEGATWLIGKVVSEIEKTTTPDLTTKGFVSEYAKMAEIASLLAAAMLLLAVLEAAAQGSWALLGKAVFVQVPLAFIGTSAAFAIVQMLLVATDGMSHAIAVATDNHSEHFFKSAISGLSKAGGTAGAATGEASTPGAGGPAGEAAGAVAVPLFVTFLAAIVGAFAAFFVWIELVMRDAAVYVCSLFVPLSLAAAIWPRWMGVLRRTAELLVVVIASKFVIVSIIALAAGLISEEGADTEHILAASALMLLACFAPFVLMKFVPFAEGAMAAAYGRRPAAGGASHGLQVASELQIIRNMARSNWSGGSSPEVWSVKSDGGSGPSPGGGGAGSSNGGGGGPGGGGPVPSGAPSSSGAAASGGGAAAAASPASAAVAAPVAAARGARSAAGRLGETAVARQPQEVAEASATRESSPPTDPAASARAPRPALPARPGAGGGEGESATGASAPSEKPLRPPPEKPVRPTPQKGGAA